MPQHYRILNLESVLGIPDQSQRILNLKRFWKDSRTVIFLLDKPRSLAQKLRFKDHGSNNNYHHND